MKNDEKIKKMTIRKGSIQKVSDGLGWKRNGTQLDSYIVDNGSVCPRNLTLIGINDHIQIRDQWFTSISLTHCKNILIENCTISKLHIEGCTNITIRNSHLLRVKELISRGNVFENNVILRESYESLIKKKDDMFYSIAMVLISLFGIFFLVSSIIGLSLLFNVWTSLIYLCSGILILALPIYYFQMWIKIKRAPSNKFQDFKELPYADLRAHFAKLGNLKY